MAHVVHEQLLRDPGFRAEGIQGLQEAAGFLVLVETEGVEDRAQAVQDEAGDAGIAQEGGPSGAVAVVEDVEGSGLAP